MSSRRGHGEHAVYFDKTKGRWAAVIEVGRDPSGKRRRRKVTAKTKREALERLRALEAELETGVDPDGSTVTVNLLLDRVINHAIDNGRQPKTIDGYRWAASHLRPRFGTTKARDVTALQIEAHLQHLVDNHNLSRSSVSRVLNVLRQALNEGMRHDWLTRNVASVARCPTSHTNTRRAVTAEQARDLIAAAEGTALHAALIVAITCGLRPGELLGLTWTNLDLDATDPTLTITHALKADSTGLYLGDVKTSTSQRRITLTDNALLALRDHRTRQLEQRLHLGAAWQDHDLVFASEVGTPWEPHNFRRALRRIGDQVGIEAITPYELRHTAVTLLSNSGIAAERIADLAGHRDTRMVERVYRHRNQTIDVGRAAMQKALGSGTA